MRIILNGTPTDTTATTLAGLLDDLSDDLPDGHAVAVDGEVVPRAAHGDRALVDGAVVEVVTAVAGG